jgi:hypothetical protein
VDIVDAIHSSAKFKAFSYSFMYRAQVTNKYFASRQGNDVLSFEYSDITPPAGTINNNSVGIP